MDLKEIASHFELAYSFWNLAEGINESLVGNIKGIEIKIDSFYSDSYFDGSWIVVNGNGHEFLKTGYYPDVVKRHLEIIASR